MEKTSLKNTMQILLNKALFTWICYSKQDIQEHSNFMWNYLVLHIFHCSWIPCRDLGMMYCILFILLMTNTMLHTMNFLLLKIKLEIILIIWVLCWGYDSFPIQFFCFYFMDVFRSRKLARKEGSLFFFLFDINNKQNV